MRSNIKYIILSSVLPLLFFIIAFSPEEILGCYTRGLTAVIIAFLSALISLAVLVKGLIKKIAGEGSLLLILCGLILSVPAIYIVSIA